MYRFNPYALPPLLTTIFIVFLATFVFIVNKKSTSNRIFVLLCLSNAIWQFGYFMVFLSKDEKTAIAWQKFVYLGVPFISPVIYHLSVFFSDFKKQKRFIPYIYLIAIMFVILSRTDYFLSGLNTYFWGYYKKAGIFYSPFLLFWTIVGLTGIWNLYKSYRITKTPLERQRKKYMFLALSIALIGIWDFIPAYGIELYPFGYLPVIICLSLVAYAIVKYRLMDISVTITRAGIFVAVYALVLGLPFMLANSGNNVWLIKLLGVNWWIGPLVLMAALGVCGPFGYIYLRSKAEAILLREQHRCQETLKTASVDMTRIRNPQKLLDFIVNIISDAVQISHSAIYLFDVNAGQFALKAGFNLKSEQPASIDRNSALIKWLDKHKEPLINEEVKRQTENNLEPILKELEKQMRSLDATVVVPSFLENKLLDILIFGDKLSGKIYTSKDLGNFSVLASEAALAIENALLYGNIEDEVKQRTNELVEVQKQLIQAEKLATVGTLAGGVAHEINNPLTAILTNAQMLLADAQSVNPDSKESLELIEEATKRCRTIVQKLMVYAKKPLEQTQVSKINLLNVVDNVVSFLSYQFEQDNIKIITEAKKDDYSVMGNQNELEQVLTNLILNAKDAIKQVKKNGEIYVSLLKNENWIGFEVKDEGAGIPKEIISKIFDPFFTTKEVGKGTGLGLSICQTIVEKHGGKITVQSELNKGAIFTVQIGVRSPHLTKH